MKRSAYKIFGFMLLIPLLAACGQKNMPTILPVPAPTDTSLVIASPAFMPTLSPTSLAATWLWAQLEGAAPTAWWSMPAVYDTNRQVTVLFGGRTPSNVPLSETWEFDGTIWRQINTLHSPPARIWHGMAYDSARQVMVLFGGDSSTSTKNYLNDTWEYNGNDWEKITTTNAPSPHGHGATLVYDTCRQKTVLFGGDSSDGNVIWEYDGTDWARKQTPVAPPERWLAAMAFDPQRCQIILFGGGASPQGLNDTWEYDGSTWTLINTLNSPPARWSHAMTYYPATSSVFLFGGYLPSTSKAANDIWAYDGKNWSPVSTDNLPPERDEPVFAYDPGSNRILLIGENTMWALMEKNTAIALTLTPRLTATSTKLPSPTPHCATGWSRLEWGGYAIVTPGDLPNRIRSAPNINPDNIISTLYPGAIVRILEGPWCNNGLVFWKVENESISGGSGWIAEGDGTEYWLEPYPPQ